MENTDQPAIDKLNHLIDLVEDGKYGYENASRDVSDEKLKQLFSHYAKERTEYARIMQTQVHNLGGVANIRDGDALGLIHRAWMDFKALITGNDRDPILNACITGEEAAIRAFKNAIDEPYISGATMQIIASQGVGIENALRTMKEHLADESFSG